jgi:glucosamine kinase
MLVIVDSGSTKADWQIVYPDGKKELISTMGFNPFFHNSERVVSELKKDFTTHVDCPKVKQLYFYGAGCSDDERCKTIKLGLSIIFPNATIEVHHDLLACARATCGTNPGISCIIGTGSNTCLYDGHDIIDNVSNLGYLLGDEGSGSHLGKMLIRAYFYRELPEDIKANFELAYPEGKRAILNKIYGDAPNVYLASFAKFVSSHKDNFYIQKLVSQAFEQLIQRHILKYNGCHTIPIHFIGSIAFHFQDILRMTLEIYELQLGIVIKKPIDNLVDYHLKNLVA